MVRSIPHTLRAGTPDLPDVPCWVHLIVHVWLTPILAWLETRLLRAVLARCAAHPLVQLGLTYDPAPVVAACAAYYHAPGTKGKPPDYTVEQLVRAEIVRSWAAACGDADLERLLAADLVVRWFVDLPLCGPTPDESTLWRFHQWVTDHQPRALFDDALAFVDRVDPEDPTATPQIVDTFAMASPAAPASSPAALLRQLVLRLVALWATQAPPAVQAALPPLDLDPLVHPAREPTPAARQARLQQAVTVATGVADGLRPHLAALDPALCATCTALVQAITKVIADETTVAADGQVQERPLDQKGDYRLMSARDLESTFRKHDPDPAVFGTNAVISGTKTRIRAAVALTGSSPDSLAPMAVLAQQQAAGRPLPLVLIMDQAGGQGKTRARVDAVSQGQTVMVARTPQPGGADLRRFTPADFQVSADGTTCTCPQGQVSTRPYQKGDGDGVYFRFLASQCRACPLWDACRGADGNPRGHRTVYVTPYHLYVRDAARLNATAAGQALLRSRWQVEPMVAWLTRYQGCRRARRVGLAAAQCQLYQACAVRNLLLWLQRRQR